MILSFAGASRQTHTRKIAETIVGTLVRSYADITLVMITIGPKTFGRSEITRTREVTHCPETRPETADFAATSKGNTGL